MTLEETKSQAEEVEPTLVEGATSTETKKEPTVRMYNQKELDEAVGKGSATINRQLSISKAEAEEAQAQTEVYKSLQEETERRLTELEEREFAGDSEALRGFRNTKTLELREKKATLRDKAQNKRDAELDGLRWAITMNNKANELQSKYTVPRDALELCTSEEQMEKIAQAFPAVGPKESEKKTPTFAGGGGSGGKNIDDMSAEDKVNLGLQKLRKK